MTFLFQTLLFAPPLRFSRQRRGVRRQRCRGIPASATPLSRAPGCPNVQPALDGGVVGAKGWRLAPLPPHSTTLSRILVTLMSLIVFCTSVIAQQTSKPVNWPGKPYDKVVGYHFTNPWGIGGLLSDQGDFNLDDVKWLQANHAELKKEQVSFLLENTFQSKNEEPTASCYQPHHVFVFYSGETAVGMIEVCFKCNSSACWPAADTMSHINFPQLEKLCGELKLEMNQPKNSKEIMQKYMADPKRKERFLSRLPPHVRDRYLKRESEAKKTP